MATRATFNLQNATLRTFIVKSGTTTAYGKAVKFDAGDDSIDNAGANEDLVFAVALEVVVGDGVNKCQVALLSGSGIVPILVGTGGATRGKFAVLAADGATDAAGSGVTNARPCIGKFLQSGVAADVVGLMPNCTRITTA